MKGLKRLLGGILVTGISVGFTGFLLDVKFGILLTFLLTLREPISGLLSSSGRLLSMSSVLTLSLSLCRFLVPVTTTLEDVGTLDLVPENLDLVLPLPAVVGGAIVSVSTSGVFSLTSSNLIFVLTLPLLMPVSTCSGLTLTLCLPLNAVPVVSDSEAKRLGL